MLSPPFKAARGCSCCDPRNTPRRREVESDARSCGLHPCTRLILASLVRDKTRRSKASNPIANWHGVVDGSRIGAHMASSDPAFAQPPSRSRIRLAGDRPRLRVVGSRECSRILSILSTLWSLPIAFCLVVKMPSADGYAAMLRRAFTRLGPRDKPILHSDQGWQYRMPVYREALQQRDVTLSMSRRGNCLDNAVMESFFATVKSEFYHLNQFRDLDDLRMGLRRYIHYYNHKRIRLKLGGLSPVEYRTCRASPALRA
jgi:hypothetical protein